VDSGTLFEVHNTSFGPKSINGFKVKGKGKGKGLDTCYTPLT